MHFAVVCDDGQPVCRCTVELLALDVGEYHHRGRVVEGTDEDGVGSPLERLPADEDPVGLDLRVLRRVPAYLDVVAGGVPVGADAGYLRQVEAGV